MRPAPRRLKAKRQRLIDPAIAGSDDGSWPGSLAPSRRHVVRKLRAARRGLTVLLFTVLAGLVQAALLIVPGRAKVAFARFYWATLCGIIGLKVRVIGAAAPTAPDGRPVVFVSNHSSWLDIPVLGGRLDACFISKDDVARWPVINIVARLGRTVYVRRKRTSTGRERDDMRARLAGGDSLVLFPEGTTSDGSRVLPFRSAFMSVAELPVTPDGLPPLVQPVSVVYDRLAGLPIGRANRCLFSWYGDMDIGSHFWRLAQNRGLRATVLLHTPLDPRAYAGRKELAQAVWAVVADGAATLRQNRPARPIGAPATPDAVSEATGAAFA